MAERSCWDLRLIPCCDSYFENEYCVHSVKKSKKHGFSPKILKLTLFLIKKISIYKVLSIDTNNLLHHIYLIDVLNQFDTQ